MLPHGAQHPGGMAVPAIGVGAGGHWPRRTSQLAPIRLCQHARGTTLRSRVVEGAQASTRRKSLRDVRTCSLASSCEENLPQRKTKLRVRRPLHHGSLAARAPVVPLPRFAGADGASALVLAAHWRPRFADQATKLLPPNKIRGGGAPKRRDCPVGPRHAADVATSMRFGRGRAFSGTRSPFGAPPRLSLRPIAEARSRPRFTRCSAQALA
jgi:hypothetical protein